MFEHKKQPVLPLHLFYQRVIRHIVIALLAMLLCLSIGILGYHYTAHIAWLDSLHNASMILSGMGPVVEIKNDAGKWFSSAYALFSGLVFISITGFILTPAIHRIFHRLNQEK